MYTQDNGAELRLVHGDCIDVMKKSGGGTIRWRNNGSAVLVRRPGAADNRQDGGQVYVAQTRRESAAGL